MTETKLQLEDWLDDLCVRFIINLPCEELESVERICFQVEEAQWFYEDFIRPLDPALPSFTLKTFALRIFQHCPLMSQWSHYHHITAFSEFLAYKTRVPVRGAILLNQAMDEVVLVKGWKKGASWSFPRGKINKDEKDLDCATREVYEETGFDIREAGLAQEEEKIKFIEITMREQHMKLYVFRGVPMDTHFEPRTRKEISKIQWYKLSELPTLQKNKNHDVINANKFYMVAPFLHPLKKWIAQQRKLDGQTRALSALLPQTEGEASTDETIQTAAKTAVGVVLEAGPSDLPEVASSQDASSHLKRLLKIGSAAVTQREPVFGVPPASRSDPVKSSALLALLRSGSSKTDNQGLQNNTVTSPQISAPIGEPETGQQDPSLVPPFPGTPPHHQRLTQQQQPSRSEHTQQSYPPNTSSPLHLELVSSQLPSSPAGYHPTSYVTEPQQILWNYSPIARAPSATRHPDVTTFQRKASVHSYSVAPSGQWKSSDPQTYQNPPRQPSVAPYQQAGDPQFGHRIQTPNAQRPTVPPASKLPPPKLTSHSLALLNVLKNDIPVKPQPAGADVVSSPNSGPIAKRKTSQHQDHLLRLLKGSPVSSTNKPPIAELSANSLPKQILQRPSRIDTSVPSQLPLVTNERQDEENLTSATVSGPLKVPQFETGAQSSRKTANGTPRKPGKDRIVATSPVTILSRPLTVRQGSHVSIESTSKDLIHDPLESKPQEPTRRFQPQILRRSEKVDLDVILPNRTVTVHEFSQDAPEGTAKMEPVPMEQLPALPNYDRRQNQTAAQKETLLALFGKSPILIPTSGTQAAEAPTVGTALMDSKFKHPPHLSTGSIPSLVVPGLGSPVKQSPGTPTINKTTPPDNRAFLLGFLEGVARESVGSGS